MNFRSLAIRVVVREYVLLVAVRGEIRKLNFVLALHETKTA